ncbi:MAG: insulinase family protein [Bacteroidaceae bacterium]|nr:insulinase family protein [Bacteroidaceae bacterium]
MKLNTINTLVLANGMRVVHVPSQGTGMVYVNMLYGVGARNEDFEHTGIAHLLEHLMFDGTKAVPSFDEPLERAGGENNAYTNNDVTCYYISLPKQNAELAFWLESDRMRNIAFNKKKVDVQRQVVIEEFKQTTLNRPYGDVSRILRAMAYKVHPYRWSTIGRCFAHIADTPVSVIRSFYNRFYAPDNAVLSVVGDIPFEQVEEWCRKWFAPIPESGFVKPQLPVEPRQTRQRRKTVCRNVPENALYMGFHMGGRMDADYYPCDVISDILSNGYSGRLLVRLVKEKRLFSKIDAFISGCEDAGMFWIYSRVPDGVAMEDAEAALWAELEQLKRELVPAEELEKVRNRFESDFTFRNLSGENLGSNVALAAMRGNLDSHFKEPEMYSAVTACDVRSAAKELFRKGNSVVLYYLKTENARSGFRKDGVVKA